MAKIEKIIYIYVAGRLRNIIQITRWSVRGIKAEGKKN